MAMSVPETFAAELLGYKRLRGRKLLDGDRRGKLRSRHPLRAIRLAECQKDGPRKAELASPARIAWQVETDDSAVRLGRPFSRDAIDLEENARESIEPSLEVHGTGDESWISGLPLRVHGDQRCRIGLGLCLIDELDQLGLRHPPKDHFQAGI